MPWDHLGKVQSSAKDSFLEEVLTNWRPEWWVLTSPDQVKGSTQTEVTVSRTEEQNQKNAHL